MGESWRCAGGASVEGRRLCCAICPATDCSRRPWWSFNKIILHGTGTKQLPNSKEVCQKINPKIILLETTSLPLIRASLNIKLVFTCSEHTAAFQDSPSCICTHQSCREEICEIFNLRSKSTCWFDAVLNQPTR